MDFFHFEDNYWKDYFFTTLNEKGIYLKNDKKVGHIGNVDDDENDLHIDLSVEEGDEKVDNIENVQDEFEDDPDIVALNKHMQDMHKVHENTSWWRRVSSKRNTRQGVYSFSNFVRIHVETMQIVDIWALDAYSCRKFNIQFNY